MTTSAERARIYKDNEPKPEFELPGKKLAFAYSMPTRVRFKDGSELTLQPGEACFTDGDDFMF
ncbi:MAG: hypothetical protein PHI12_12650 [Dehalococcoidales bacterium]|jgi:hypothetical protein|nr:hypothetical protein [Sphaerochaeta sp.]MDD5511640.1 hypothetical protein [Dehalococcoidales bacterium]